MKIKMQTLLLAPVRQSVNGKNQFTLLGYSYDAAGNVLQDGSKSTACAGNAYTWNAEEEMTCALGASYTYDGDGIRVKKTGGSATPTLYWGAGTLAESDTSGNLTSEYIFLSGRRIARRDVATGSVYYYFADELGSSNVVATAAGALENESDFYPFGGELPVTQNLTNQHYKFEGKERDPESASLAQPQGLDNFGARFDSSAMGRFMSPDWANSPEPVPYSKLGNPQTLNLYAFTLNNPESAPDMDGHVMSLEQYHNSLWYTGHPDQLDADGAVASAASDAWEAQEQQNEEAKEKEQSQPELIPLAQAPQQISNTSGQDDSHYVSISDYPKGAGGFGHTGIAVDSDDTHGFSAFDPHTAWWKRLFGAPAARMEDDLEMHTKNGEVAPHSFIHIPISAAQAQRIKAAIASRTDHPGRYNLFFNNCAQEVGSALHAGGVAGVPHGEIFIPAIFGAVVWYTNTWR